VIAATKLTVYFGERDRVGRGFLADALIEAFARHRLRVAVLLRGTDGFGIEHQLRTDRLLTLSEDLPIVAVAVDEPEVIERVLAEVRKLSFDGLVTLERAQMVDGQSPRAAEFPSTAKLTAYPGRGVRLGGRPAYEEAVGILRSLEVDGASVLVGVDGVISGERRRATFFGRNESVPAMVISVGAADRLAEAATRLEDVLGVPMTVERVEILKRDGEHRTPLPAVDGQDSKGRARWQQLTLYSSEQHHFDGVPAHQACIRQLRRQGAMGATALRGIWGYHGDHAPHGDSLLAIRRRVPTLTVVVDEPAEAQRRLEALDLVSPTRGLITSEVVPAIVARAAADERGGLRLSDLWTD
jgi:PII-like signaling protein